MIVCSVSYYLLINAELWIWLIVSVFDEIKKQNKKLVESSMFLIMEATKKNIGSMAVKLVLVSGNRNYILNFFSLGKVDQMIFWVKDFFWGEVLFECQNKIKTWHWLDENSGGTLGFPHPPLKICLFGVYCLSVQRGPRSQFLHPGIPDCGEQQCSLHPMKP